MNNLPYISHGQHKINAILFYYKKYIVVSYMILYAFKKNLNKNKILLNINKII